MIGASLDQYEITASIGAGGMGEVFRARDTRLNRDVAVKVLPKDFVADADRLRRFVQEAKTLATLNHPNILTIHDAGVHEGAPYLVSELLEGKTLREAMNGSALPLRKVKDYSLQIAHGLAAAHGKRIVHRDLKPENIFVTTDGRVKILDFGLAKLKDPSPALLAPSPLGGESDGVRGAEADPSSPTLINSTQPGMVLGTPAYMAPEQVRGEPADHHADIFAFGCVLYEMLSGTRAFRRNTPVETMNAILAEEPPDFVEVNPSVASPLERVARRCLEKRPAGRFQTATDLAFAIETVGAVPTSAWTNRTILSHGGALKPEWHPNGSELFYLSLDGRALMSVPVKRDGAWQLSEPVKVCDLPESIYAGGAFGENAFDVTSDGQKFLMLQTTKDESSPQPLPKPSALVVENWFEEFREKK